MNTLNKTSMKILLAAAEDKNLPDCQVGGVADVLAGASLELAALGHAVTVCVPSYGYLQNQPGAEHIGSVRFPFGGSACQAELYWIPGLRNHPNLNHIVIDHPIFGGARSSGRPQIFFHDPANRPFATDATRFALFSAALAHAIQDGTLEAFDVIHLHDWHLAFVLMLRALNPQLKALRTTRFVYTIHNLAMQGIRPYSGDPSSWEAWFPGLPPDATIMTDPRWPDCLNPMAAAIRLADLVHTVSPPYAEEIQLPNDPRRNFHGGEGLEALLREAKAQGRLIGILNGCEYPLHGSPRQHVEVGTCLARLCQVIERFIGESPSVPGALLLAHCRIKAWLSNGKRPKPLVTCASRLTDQKCFLMKQAIGEGVPAMQKVLDAVGKDGLCVIVGTGAAEYLDFFGRLAGANPNFVHIPCFSAEAARVLYECGDLFLMPSSFEPSGIAQMHALACAQPVVAHDVGGLRVTVRNGATGFVFSGESPREQAANFVSACERALRLFRTDPAAWQQFRDRAAAERFTWQTAVTAYVAQLYRPGHDRTGTSLLPPISDQVSGKPGNRIIATTQ